MTFRQHGADSEGGGPSRRLAILGGTAAALLVVGVLLIVTREAPPRTETLPPAPAASPAGPAAEPAVPAGEPAVALLPGRRPRPPAPARKAPEPEAAPAASAPVLRVDSDVPGAFVFVDRKYLGTTPLETRDVTPGTHQVNVSAEGYDGVARTIEIGADPIDLTVKLKEVRLDARVDVVHKHLMGSCTGRLVATLDGLRYETSRREDAFSLPLAALEQFDVDYLEKNLRVKRTGGKTWNFTTATGSADPLLVFQQTVDKARAKLPAR